MRRTQLTKEQKDFLLLHGVSDEQVYDACGQTRNEYANAMQTSNYRVAIGVTPCRRHGHTIRTRKGHCAQCSPASLGFQERFHGKGFVYVAYAESLQLVKVGVSEAPLDRARHMQRQGYGGAKDWKILWEKMSPRAYEIEAVAHKALREKKVRRVHQKDGSTKETYEIFECEISEAIGILNTITISHKEQSQRRGSRSSDHRTPLNTSRRPVGGAEPAIREGNWDVLDQKAFSHIRRSGPLCDQIIQFRKLLSDDEYFGWLAEVEQLL